MRIYDGYRVVNGMAQLFSVNDSEQGHFNLIFTASESTSGRYTCRPGLKWAQQSAEVIVLGKYLWAHFLDKEQTPLFDVGLKL